MKIGIISDSHDQINNLKKAVAVLKQQKIETLIHCGDLCAPFMIKELDKIGIPVHVVFGNTDDRYKTPLFANESNNVKMYGDLGEIELDSKKIAFIHFDHLGFALACTKKYDVVFYGHTHKQNKQTIDKTLLVNPGEIYGKFGKITFAIYETNNDEVSFFGI